MGAAGNLSKVLEQIEQAEQRAARPRGSVALLPVSKTKDAEFLKTFLELPNFPRCLGENYANELEDKSQSLGEYRVEWHFIGPLQSRKIKDIAKSAQMIHTVCREKELRILAALSECPRFMFQVNVSGEGQKNGCEPAELLRLLELTEELSLKDKISGLMCLPSLESVAGEKELRTQFALLRELRDRHLPRGLLSMGMSQDLEWAIAEGSNMVRVGTALFGSR